MHGRRRRRSVSSPTKFIGGAVGAGIKLVKKMRDRKKGSAEDTARAEGAASGEMKSANSMKMGGLMGGMADFMNRGKRTGGLRGMVERVVDEKLEGGGEKPKESEEKVLKTPKNDATTKELTTSTKDDVAKEAVARLYKQ